MRRHLVLLAVLALPLAAPAMAEDAPRQIVVTGEGRVEAAPDIATVTAGVQTEATEAAPALAATSEAMRAVFDALAAAGIAPSDMQTSQLSVDPVWADDGAGVSRVRGYSASNLVTIRVREIGELGAVIDAVGKAGANRVFGIAFELAEPRAQLDAARERAVADARAKAELLATAAGVKLGAVQSIRESGDSAPGPMFARAEMDAAPPVAEGVVGLEARVEIVYGIE